VRSAKKEKHDKPCRHKYRSVSNALNVMYKYKTLPIARSTCQELDNDSVRVAKNVYNLLTE